MTKAPAAPAAPTLAVENVAVPKIRTGGRGRPAAPNEFMPAVFDLADSLERNLAAGKTVSEGAKRIACTPDDVKSIVTKLRSAARKCGVTIRSQADETGVTFWAVPRIERAKTN